MKKHRTRKLSKRRGNVLTAMILAGFSALPSVAAAEIVEVPMEHLYHDGKTFADLTFFPKGTGLGSSAYWYADQSQYTLSETLQSATVSSAAYWSDILGDGAKITQPWQIYVNTDLKQNAGAISKSIRSDGANRNILTAGLFVPEQIQNGKSLSVLNQEYLETHGNTPAAGEYGFSEVTIGKYMGAAREGAELGWWVDTDTVLPTNEQAADFVGTFRHELGHALGISLKKDTIGIGKPKNSYQFIRSDVTANSRSLHLMDQTGKMAKPGMFFVTTDNPANTLAKLNADREAEGKFALTEADVFIVNKNIDADGNGYAYFVGENVTDALGGATFFGRNGLPVNGYEDWKFEGSHLQTTGMMSHRVYSNYTSFMEVELAVMQDLGYKIDRKAYFGKSIYGNGGTITNTQGYFARNGNGTAYLENTYSAVPLGIGLHIYGSNNMVTQAANILTRGAGATGIRMDGVGNTLNIPEGTEIHADGLRGNGILIAYGSGQTVNQSGTVTASGQGGTGIRFDFGSSTNGADDEYRGSYIRYKRKVNTDGTMTATGDGLGNLPLRIESSAVYNAAPDELNGAMVENYNLSGALVGGENAIYIGKNAFVKNININNGASIRGPIISDWKRFGAEDCAGSYDIDNPLKIQYNSGSYDYSAYIPDLVTNLNFNTDMTYTGNIIGEDNLKIFVNGGKLSYGGTANVVSVQVAKGAALFGGKYVLNRLTPAAGFTDDTIGTFINHGTIAPIDDTNMTINGNLDSDGAIGLVTYNGGHDARIVDVNKNGLEGGVASLNGTTLFNVEEQIYLPKQEYVFLEADTINGTLASKVDDNFSGFLDIAEIFKSGGTSTTYSVALKRDNNFPGLDANQRAVYDSLDEIYDRADAAGRTRIGKLYSLGVEKGKIALTDISTGPATDASFVMRQNTVMNALTARHRYLTHQANVPVSIPMKKLVSHYAATSPSPSTSSVDPGLDMIVPVELSEGGGLWFKFAKGWGSYGKGDVTGNGFTTTVGADFVLSPQWKLGALFSYSNESYGGMRDHRDTKDSRFGVYGDWRVGPQSAFLYIGGGWQKHDQTRHFYAGNNYNANADYTSNTIEFNGRYTYDLSYGKNGWHHKPFVTFQAVHYRQGSYTENGAREFGQAVDSANNTYTAASVGWDFARDFGKQGYVEFELGVSQALGGDSMSCTANLMGIGPKFTLRSASMDKTRILAGVYGSQALSDRWRIGGEVGLAQGAYDRDVTASISLRYSW